LSQANQQVYEFGAFRLDAEKRSLERDGQVVALAPKAFDMLLVLVRHHGEVLDKDRLMELLWPDQIVEEANLPQNVSALRKALGESPNERKYIVTVPGRGYRFAAEVKPFTGDSQNLLVEKYTKTTLVIEEGVPEGPEPSKGLPSAWVVSRHRPKWLFLSLALLILVLGVAALYFRASKQPVTNTAIQSLAIMPFVNASQDANAEYLSDGITENLINILSQLPRLKVTARATAFRYKGKDPETEAIRRDLRVDAIITGRVTQQGDNLIVQADLLSTTDGTQIWGHRYRCKLSDIFAVQEEIATAIAENLRFKLTGEEKRALGKRYTENIKAYQNYQLGWNYLQRRTRQDFFTAIAYFEKAIAEEPNYALAYAALTEAYLSLTIRGFIEPVEGRRQTEKVAQKALALDPNLAEAYAAIGATHVFFAPFDFATGDRELRHALELSPSLEVARLHLGASLMEQGRLDEALEVWAKARELDPLSPIIARLEAIAYFYKRDYPRSLDLLRQSKELGPSFIIWSEIEIYIQNNQLDEGIAELEKAKMERKDDPILIHGAGMIAAAQGRRAEALRTIKELEQLSGASLHRAMWIAMIYAILGDKASALEWLERGLEAGAIVIFYKDESLWDSLRNDPRFAEFLQRMAIPR
jgi:TolB-like protein/DNA-binding winged helix-turn-helix (wHTH) protein/Flp pilus assembly protein TadD